MCPTHKYIHRSHLLSRFHARERQHPMKNHNRRNPICTHSDLLHLLLTLQKVLPLLTEEEQAVYKRGRNANVHTMSRSATPAQYHSATGLECLMGYLYLKGDKNRAEELFRAMMEET